ncbi:hypothetical protein Theco_3118 [Thermobacillus composti KWC4]|uniref:Uncharacterized protein n=1 Tax=Thermobacillus composti (strain DSM 18247 / JCM 13945 / KWC4) TaxID=717605 RepID=L0EHQ8_THECK|nr:hypothetical protein [Thermobacillus composti]AGA59174.1 hypothetical protein Theco_3118 [Thermobacillus composti KWC4]
MKTLLVEVSGGMLEWPSDVPNDAWFLAYTHSELLLKKGPEPLHPARLYEAWAFDGTASWHLWQREDQWICTKYDADTADKRLVMEGRQVLSDTAIKKLASVQVNARYLVIHELIEFDEDGQAFVAYSCPINLA